MNQAFKQNKENYKLINLILLFFLFFGYSKLLAQEKTKVLSYTNLNVYYNYEENTNNLDSLNLPLIKNQSLIFERNKKIKVHYFNFNKNIYVLIQNFELYKFLNNYFIKVYGWGGCNTCMEYEGFFNLKGELLVEELINKKGFKKNNFYHYYNDLINKKKAKMIKHFEVKW